MIIQQQHNTLRVREIPELGAATAGRFQSEVRAAMAPSLEAIEIDLSETRRLDSCGLGALIALYKSASNINGSVPVRIVNPNSQARQLFELTRMDGLFEIVNTEP